MNDNFDNKPLLRKPFELPPPEEDLDHYMY